MRHTYLGAARDYLVELDGGPLMRVSTRLGAVAAQGDTVTLHLPPNSCRAPPR